MKEKAILLAIVILGVIIGGFIIGKFGLNKYEEYYDQNNFEGEDSNLRKVA